MDNSEPWGSKRGGARLGLAIYPQTFFFFFLTLINVITSAKVSLHRNPTMAPWYHTMEVKLYSMLEMEGEKKVQQNHCRNSLPDEREAGKTLKKFYCSSGNATCCYSFLFFNTPTELTQPHLIDLLVHYNILLNDEHGTAWYDTPHFRTWWWAMA